MRNATPLLALVFAFAVGGCKRTPDPAPEAPVAPTPPPPTPPTQNTATADAAPAAPAGPTQELRGDEYRLAVSVTAPNGATPGAFRVELHGNGEFHVNEQYPIAVEATVENGSMPKTSLRRGDAAEFTQAGARFEQPLTATGPGVRVHGTVRFGVCRAEQCAFFNREYAVALASL